MASRLSKGKFHELIIDAMCNKNLKSDIVCHFAGDGEYKNILKEKVKKKN